MDTENIFVEFEKYLRRRFPKRRTLVDYLSDLRQFRSACQKSWREMSMHDIDAFVEQTTHQQAEISHGSAPRGGAENVLRLHGGRER